MLVAATAAGADPPGLVARLGSDRFRQEQRVDAITYSPDGKHLATADGVGAPHLECPGRATTSFGFRRQRCVLCARYSPDGRALFAAATAGGITHLYKIDPAGKVIESRNIQFGNANGRFSPDAAWLAVRDQSGPIFRVIDTATGLAWIDRSDDELFSGYAWRADSKAVISATTAGRLRLYDPKSGNVLHQHRLEGGAVWSMAFSPDGKDIVAEVGAPGHVVRLDAATGEVRWKHGTHQANELAFTSDGKRVFYFGTAGTSREAGRWHFLDAGTGKPAGVMDAGYGHAVAVRPDGKVLGRGGIDGLISQYDLTTHQRLDDSSADPPDAVTHIRFSLDGTKVQGWARGWYEWDVKTGHQKRLTPKLEIGATEPIAVSDDQRWLGRFVEVDATKPSQCALIDLRTGQRAYTLDGIKRDDNLRFQPDGRLLAIGKSALLVFDPATGHAPARNRHRTGPDGGGVVDRRFAAVVGPVGEVAGVALWDLTSGKKTNEWSGTIPQQGVLEEARAWDGGLSADGRLLMIQFVHAKSYSNRTTRFGVFDARTGRLHSAWAHQYWMRPAFSPDGRTAACRVPGPTGIEIREVVTGERRMALFGRRHVDDCVFAPDGRTLAASTRPGPVEIWDMRRALAERDVRGTARLRTARGCP